MRNDLMLAPSALSKLEREMIAVAVSSHNRCYYCLVAHGAAVRALSGDPALGELMVMNYRAALLSARERAMLDFAVKLTAEPWSVEEADRAALRRADFNDREYLGHRRGRGFFQYVEPHRVRHRHAAEQRLSRPGALTAVMNEIKFVTYHAAFESRALEAYMRAFSARSCRKDLWRQVAGSTRFWPEWL
jgi:AhpD family alkylhydroperoxidase